nr:imidazole glycerol phosphate synthase subunit hisH [Cyanidioschyzonaceae sp. 3]WDB00335.1 imidazole glycerol phosphate synthase subunit hisH [Cyanidiococcus yangmingshanensis]
MMIGILDYSMGNLHSVYRAIKHVDTDVCIVKHVRHLNHVDMLVVPGVGHFDLAMKKLEEKGLKLLIQNWIQKGNPYIGICLGMHILFESSEEGNEVGLGIYKSKVLQLPSQILPHMGWNQLHFQSSRWVDWSKWSQPTAWAYFVHSYGVIQEVAESHVCATTKYEQIQMVAAIERENCFAMQFHPEKSSQFGLWLWQQLLKKKAAS